MAEGRGGVVKKFLDHTTPSARTNEASRLFRDRAATPPPAEEGSLEPVPRLGLSSNLIQMFASSWVEPCSTLNTSSKPSSRVGGSKVLNTSRTTSSGTT